MDGSSDGHLHGTLTIKVIAAKNLPDTDSNFWNIRSKDVTDPFVRGDFGTEMIFESKHIETEIPNESLVGSFVLIAGIKSVCCP